MLVKGAKVTGEFLHGKENGMVIKIKMCNGMLKFKSSVVSWWQMPEWVFLVANA